MNKDYLAPLAWIAILFVGSAFLIMSLFVFLTRGKSAFWTNKKMKLGGVLLTLTAMVNSGCVNSCQTTCYDVMDKKEPDPEVMCYDVAATNVVLIDSDTLGNVLINNKITGVVENPDYEEYAYTLLKDKTNDTLQMGILKLSENDTLSYQRTFSIEINEKLAPGRYWINVYNFKDAFDKHASSLASRQINIE